MKRKLIGSERYHICFSNLYSVMLSYIPVVDGAIRVTSCKHLDVTVGILNIRLAIVDVVLMQSLLGLHHSVGVKLCSIEEHSTASKCICADV